MKNPRLIRLSLIIFPAIAVISLGSLLYFMGTSPFLSLDPSFNTVVQTRDAQAIEHHQATAIWRYLAIALLLAAVIIGYQFLQKKIAAWRCHRLERAPCKICGRLQRRVQRTPQKGILSCQCYPAYTGLMDEVQKK